MKNILLSLFVLNLIISCKVNNKNDDPKDTVILKENKPRSKSDSTPRNAPIINIADTVALPYHFISVKDSAVNNVRLSLKLGFIYSDRLSSFIKHAKLKITGHPMACYKTQKAPFFFEAGIAIDKKPTKLEPGIIYKHLGKRKVIVAHFFGPYEETVQAYQILKEWLKDNKKIAIDKPYEIYVEDPLDENGKAKDPYQVQTDIVIPYE